MDETTALIQSAEYELAGINEELDLQTEKFIGIQEKIGRHRKNLYDTDAALNQLQNALKIRKFIVLILFIVVMFSLLFFLIRNFK